MSFKFQITTPEKIVHTSMADSVSVPTVDGEITILSNHMPLISAVKIGVLHVKHGKEEIYMAVDGGILKMDKGGLMILANSAERADDLIEEQVRKAQEDAKKAMEEKRSGTVEFTQAFAALERETMKLRAIRRSRSARGGSIGASNIGE
ncbi:MAG: ATP synthase F0F1 subunit epsilon, F-type H+-transporting ATPase subunit epsilon [Candidatus Peregrinibacteria bacterium GW2011_GWC2_39_14]|nr:MAG: ATP synthase epsilon chain [Candidatus Peregrinibacteria bacterium GW2011_GWA2_38_36]KKR04984.1 MAG: ATP synthase F0F1 subunit epsilon, F-type H+-transporting ATPase subunit epsilon [Candidatus Peregrinibacteria bacterium GW2011_GWC2_39_14]